MQTGLPTFESQVVGSSSKVQKTASSAGAASNDAAPDQLAGFMEIMSALLTLPQEQFRQSLAGLDAVTGDDGSAIPTCPEGISEKNWPPADLLNLFMNMKGEVLQELRSAQADGKPHPLLVMAEALVEAPQLGGTDSREAAEVLKAQGADPDNALSQLVKDALEGMPATSEEINENSLSYGRDPRAGKGGHPLIAEPVIDEESIVPDDGKEIVAKPSRDSNPVKEFLVKTSETLVEGGSAPAADKTAPPLRTGMANMSEEKAFPDENGRSNDRAHQDLSADALKSHAVKEQPAADGGILEERSVQKVDTPAGGQQGHLWRTETGPDSKGISMAGSEKAMYQDKAEPSDVIRQIVQRMSMHTNGVQSKMVIRLKPEFLGNVHMQILTDNHQVTVRMMADSIMVKEIVEQNLPHLQAELQHHGLEIQKFDVFVANDDTGSRNGQEQAGFKDAMNRRQARSGGDKTRHRRGKVTLDTGNEKKIVQKDPGEIDYFA